MHEAQVEAVGRAIASIRNEPDLRLITELENDQLAAATGLEWYGITLGTFERFINQRTVSDPSRELMKKAIKAIEIMYGN